LQPRHSLDNMSLELESLVTTECPSLSTGSTESLSTARKWLKTCRTEHSSCCRAGTHPESHSAYSSKRRALTNGPSLRTFERQLRGKILSGTDILYRLSKVTRVLYSDIFPHVYFRRSLQLPSAVRRPPSTFIALLLLRVHSLIKFTPINQRLERISIMTVRSSLLSNLHQPQSQSPMYTNWPAAPCSHPQGRK